MPSYSLIIIIDPSSFLQHLDIALKRLQIRYKTKLLVSILRPIIYNFYGFHRYVLCITIYILDVLFYSSVFLKALRLPSYDHGNKCQVQLH